MSEREQVEKAKQKVLAVYPDAEPYANDYNAHWIGLPRLSEAFEEDPAQLEEVHKMPLDTPEQVDAADKAYRHIQQQAQDQAWIDAASRLPAPVSQPVAAQVESGDGLPPLEPAGGYLGFPQIQKYAQMQDFETDEQMDMQSMAVELLESQAEIERLKGLLRYILEYYPDSFEQEDKNRIKAAVTGE